MACCPVRLAALLVISSVAIVSGGGVPQVSVSSCEIRRYGKLTQFVQNNHVGNNVELPCTYVLANFTKNAYKVTVWAKSNLDEEVNSRFSPDYVRVRIKNTNTGELWLGKTNTRRLNARVANTQGVWEMLEPPTLTPTQSSLNIESAVVAVSGVFRLTFSRADQDDKGIKIEVYGEVDSNPYPQSLCGSTVSGVNFRGRQQLLFGDHTLSKRSMVFTYDILTNFDINQNPTCNRIGQTLHYCSEDRRALAIRICSPIYSTRPLSKCLMDPSDPQASFDNCLVAVCFEQNSPCDTVNRLGCNDYPIPCYTIRQR